MRTDFSIKIVEGLSNFEHLRWEWDQLHARAAMPHHVFQSHSFLRHWAEHYLGVKAKLLVVCGRIENELVMVWPLILTRKFGVKVLTFMGAPTAQFFDVLIDERVNRTPFLNAGWRTVSGIQADVFVSNNIRSDAMFRSCTAANIVEYNDTTAPFAKLFHRVDGENPGPVYSARERSNYRRRVRRASEHGEISFTALLPGLEAAAAAGKAISFKKRLLLSKAIWSPTVSDPRFGQFFETLAADPDSAVRISTINCDNKVIGIEVAFDCNGHAYGHVLATDPDNSLDGIGSLLIHRAFISAAARGMHTFEMLAPADQYKLQHSDGAIPVSSLTHAFTHKGRLYRDLFLRNVEPRTKSLVKRYAAPLIARTLRA